MDRPKSRPTPEAGATTREWLWVAAFLLLALLLRLYRLSAQSIWVDEMLTLASSGVTAPLHPIDVIDNLHGPLHSLIVFLWTRVAGTGEFAVRFPSVVFSVLSLYAIYRLIRRLSDSRTALFALGLMSVSPFHVWYGQEARNYSMLLFFSAMSFDSFFDLLERPERSTFGKYVLFTFAAFLSNISAAFVLLVQDIVFLFWPRKLSFRSLAVAHLLLALLLFPWLKEMFERVEFHRLARTEPYSEAEFLRGETTFTPLALPYSFFVFSAGYSLGPSLRELHEAARVALASRHAGTLALAAFSFAVPFIVGLLSLRRHPRLLVTLILWLAVPLTIISFFAVKNFKPFNPRYVMVAYPAYVLLVAAGLRWSPASAPWQKTVKSVLVILVLVTSAISLSNYFTVEKYWKDDFRAAGALLNTEFQAGDAIFTEGTYEPLVYYLEDRVTFMPLFPYVLSDEDTLRARVLRQSTDARRVWLVTSRLWNLDPERKVPSMFGELFQLKEEHHFEGVDVLLLSNVTPAHSQTH